MVEQTLPGGKPCQWECRTLGVIECSGLGGEHLRWDRYEVRGGTIEVEPRKAEDLLVDRWFDHSRPSSTTTPENSYEGAAGRRSTGQSSSSRVMAAACTLTTA